MVHRVTTSDNERQRVVQPVTTNDNEWYNEWYNRWQRGRTNDNEWQRVAISANSSFFRIREESTTKHPKDNKEDLEEKRDIELRAEGSP